MTFSILVDISIPPPGRVFSKEGFFNGHFYFTHLT